VNCTLFLFCFVRLISRRRIVWNAWLKLAYRLWLYFKIMGVRERERGGDQQGRSQALVWGGAWAPQNKNIAPPYEMKPISPFGLGLGLMFFAFSILYLTSWGSQLYCTIYIMKQCNNNNKFFLFHNSHVADTPQTTSVMIYIASVHRKRFVYIISLNVHNLYCILYIAGGIFFASTIFGSNFRRNYHLPNQKSWLRPWGAERKR